MPIYEYQCDNCGTVFDSLQKIADPDPTACPNCDFPKVSRRVTAPSFRLAGSGWYETDFKKDGDKKRNLAGDSSSDSPPATPAAKTDAPATSAPPAAPAAAISSKSNPD